MQTYKEFNATLALRLLPAYTIGNIGAGHTVVHTNSMKRLGPRILGIKGAGDRRLKFDLNEFDAAVDCHNADRSYLMKREIEELGDEGLYRKLLADSPYSSEARDRIVSAALNHHNKVDNPGDPPLDQAIRIADKVDRFAPCGIVGCGASHYNKDHYDYVHPFWGGGATGEDDLPTHYKMFFRPLVWYGMLPSDEARGLINGRWLRLLIEFLRCFGEEIALNTGSENRVEEDLKIAFGKYYDEIVEICGLPHAG